MLFGTAVCTQANRPPTVADSLVVNTANNYTYNVTIRILNAPATFVLAMATHHEYDDRFWRCVENFEADLPLGKAAYVKNTALFGK